MTLDLNKWERNKVLTLIAAEAATYAGYAAMGRLKESELEYYELQLKPLYEKVNAYVPPAGEATPMEVLRKLQHRLRRLEFMDPKRASMLADVDRINKRLNYDKASDAITMGHHMEYAALLLAWDHVYGKQADHETRQGSSAEHSGAPELQGPVDGAQQAVGDPVSDGRRDPEASG